MNVYCRYEIFSRRAGDPPAEAGYYDQDGKPTIALRLIGAQVRAVSWEWGVFSLLWHLNNREFYHPFRLSLSNLTAREVHPYACVELLPQPLGEPRHLSGVERGGPGQLVLGLSGRGREWAELAYKFHGKEIPPFCVGDVVRREPPYASGLDQRWVYGRVREVQEGGMLNVHWRQYWGVAPTAAHACERVVEDP